MTKKEAVEFELRIAKLFEQCDIYEPYVSLNLIGHFAIKGENIYLTFDIENYPTLTPYWVRYYGEYEELQTIIQKCISIIAENKKDIKKLINSYREKYDD